jgi:hypothetical protein
MASDEMGIGESKQRVLKTGSPLLIHGIIIAGCIFNDPGW